MARHGQTLCTSSKATQWTVARGIQHFCRLRPRGRPRRPRRLPKPWAQDGFPHCCKLYNCKLVGGKSGESGVPLVPFCTCQTHLPCPTRALFGCPVWPLPSHVFEPYFNPQMSATWHVTLQWDCWANMRFGNAPAASCSYLKCVRM